MSSFLSYVLAAYPVLSIDTFEEFRMLTDLISKLSKTQVQDKNGNPIGTYKSFVWDVVDGARLVKIGDKGLQFDKEPTAGTKNNPFGALEFLEKAEDGTVLFVKDFHPFLDEKFADATSLTRKIRNLSGILRAQAKLLVFVSPEMKIPKELEKDVTVVNYGLPERADLHLVLKGICHATGAKLPKGRELDSILDALMGMTSIEAENSLSVSLVDAHKFDPVLIRKEKAAIVKKSKVLEVVDCTESLDDIGGLEELKDWINGRKNCFTPEARAFGVLPLRALLFLGIAGCGKSLTAKAIATAFGRPLLRLDFSNIMDKWVGGSEGKMKGCFELAEAVSPCILWVDEIEKSMAGSGSQEGHEVTQRIFGMLLTWLQEKKKDVILVATANSIANLRPELISRFNACFWVDLPDPVQRLEILKIHLKKAGRPNLFTDTQLANAVTLSDTFNGREIEDVVKDSVTRAFSKGHKQILISDLEEALTDIRPINKIKADELNRLREDAAKMNVKPASRKRSTTPASEQVGVRRINTSGSGDNK